MSTPVVIPAKPLERALSRLGRLLGPQERTAVQMAMLADVIGAACGFSEVVLVVTGDERIAAVSADLGARVIADATPPAGIDVAVARGVAVAGTRDALILMGDVPLATSDDLHALAVALGSVAGVACARSADGTGTNAMYLRPTTGISAAFGPGSLARHRAAAADAGVRFVELQAPGLELDIDTPEDLAALVRSGRVCTTTQVCERLGVSELVAAGARA